MAEAGLPDQAGIPTDRVVSVRGLTLHTRRRPGNAAPPLLLIHGLGGSMDSWQPLLDSLPDRDVVMIDTPGMGRSELPERPLPIHGLADVLAAALTELGIERVDVLGYSLGGTVAQEFVHRHPLRVRRLVLAATVAGIPWLPPNARSLMALLSTKRYHDRDTAVRAIPLLAGGRTARDPDVLAALVADRESHPPSKRGYRYLQIAVLGWSSHLWLHSLRCRTLVVAGTEDPVVRPINARILARRIRDSTVEIVDGAGHMMLFDEPERLARILTEFLSAP